MWNQWLTMCLKESVSIVDLFLRVLLLVGCGQGCLAQTLQDQPEAFMEIIRCTGSLR